MYATIFTFGITPQATAASAAAEANAALSFWIAWGFVYLGIGVVLMAVAAAVAVRERRAWSSLLEWTERGMPEDDDASAKPNAEGRRAA